MGLQTAISRHSPSTPSEMSRLAPHRESKGIFHNHNHIKSGNEALARLQSQIAAMQKQINIMAAQNRALTSKLFPFKIYQLPWQYRMISQPNDWLKVRVHGGRVFIGSIIQANGTDNCNNPDIETYLDGGNTAVDIVVPNLTDKYYLWVKYDSANAQVYFGTDPANAAIPNYLATNNYTNQADTWGTFPNTDANHVLIGWVNTNCYTNGANILNITQLVRSDIFGTGSGGGTTITSYAMVNANLPSSGNPTFSDYIVVQDGGGLNWPVAKPPELRCSLSGETREGISYTFSYLGTATLLYQRRTSTGNNLGLIEGITPPYCPGQIRIYACTPGNGTNVTIASGDTTNYGGTGNWSTGTAITLLDMNVDARAWAVLSNQSGQGS